MPPPAVPVVLVVDDQPEMLRFLQSALKRFGYAVLSAASGGSALETVREHGPLDLLLTDLLMPDMRGDELAAALQQRQPGLKVLYLTGFSDRLFETRGRLNPFESYLDKPVTLAELHDAVSIAIYNHRGGPPLSVTA